MLRSRNSRPQHSDSSSPAGADLLYVGIEAGLAGWLPTFATRIHKLQPATAALLQDTFWTHVSRRTFLCSGIPEVRSANASCLPCRSACPPAEPAALLLCSHAHGAVSSRWRHRCGLCRHFPDRDRTALAPPDRSRRIDARFHVRVGRAGCGGNAFRDGRAFHGPRGACASA